MPKETLRIDSHVLQPWREIAGILGMTVSGYVGRHLDGYRNQIQAEGLVFFAEEAEAYSYETRELAQSVADRFEAFAIEAKLEGRPNIGTISTAVVPTDE